MLDLNSLRIFRVANGWILEPYHPEMGPVRDVKEIYIFNTMKELCEFLLMLSENKKQRDEQ